MERWRRNQDRSRIIYCQHNRFQALEFNQSFKIEPVIFSTIYSFNDENTVTWRFRNISTNGFKLSLSEQESNRKSKHAHETVGYIAWEPGSGSTGAFQYEVGKIGDAVTDMWHQTDFQSQFTENPFFFAVIQSYNSRENSTVRYQYLTTTDIHVSIEEQGSKDSEIAHTNESVGYTVFGMDMN